MVSHDVQISSEYGWFFYKEHWGSCKNTFMNDLKGLLENCASPPSFTSQFPVTPGDYAIYFQQFRLIYMSILKNPFRIIAFLSRRSNWWILKKLGCR